MTVFSNKPEINLREKLTELDTKASVAGRAFLRAENTVEQAQLLGLQPQRNMFINGDQQVWQYGTSFTNIGATQEDMISDRWRHYAVTGGRSTWSRSTDAPYGFEYSLKIECTTASSSPSATHRLNVAYRMTSEDARILYGGGERPSGESQARGFTIQFWVKTNRPGVYCLDSYFNVTAPTCKKTYTIEKANVWQHVVLTFPHHPNGASNPSFWWWLMAGSNYTTNDRGENWTTSTDGRAYGQTTNILDTVGNTFYIAGIQMVPGEYPDGVPFAHRQYSEELQLCQRYYYLRRGHVGQRHVIGYATSTSQFNGVIDLPVTMRTTPALITSGTTTDYTLVHATGGVVNIGSLPTYGGTEDGGYILCTGASGLTAGSGAQLRSANSSGFLAFDAEM
jgi:hypothetical protein